MPEIRAFKGLRYSARKVRDMRRVVAPPYDVISKAQQEALYSADPHNVIRLELGKVLPADNAAENQYTRAKAYLEDWTSERILEADSEPCIYVYRQTYAEKNRQKVRIGFLAAMKINEKAVLKHENTLAAPKEDRMNLIKATQTNLSPIWGLYEDTSKAVYNVLKNACRATAQVDIALDGVRHQLFALSDARAVDKIQKAMKVKPMFIADGHHRFEVACAYKKWARANGLRGNADYVMTYFSDCTNNPFTIYPTHRLVSFHLSGADLFGRLSSIGTVSPCANLQSALKRLEHSSDALKKIAYDFAVYYKKRFYHLSLSPAAVQKISPKDPVASLDVAVLHRFIIEPVFGIKKIEKSKEIDFTRDAHAAVEAVDRGRFQAAFFLRPTSLKQMLLASKKGLKMPQKSTYFYPKLLSGLVFHRLNHD